MPDVVILLAVAAIVAVVGFALGMLVAPVVGRLGDPDPTDDDEEDRDAR